jgi:hypothetical protein
MDTWILKGYWDILRTLGYWELESGITGNWWKLGWVETVATEFGTLTI